MSESLPPPLRRHPALALGVCCFGILALELALIRWVGAQIRIFAYFANLVLLAAFLGMGLGVALGRRRPQLVRWALPALAGLSAILAFSEQLGLVRLRFPDPSIILWGSETRTRAWALVGVTGFVLGLFWLIAVVFSLAAAPVGYLFDRLPPLRAYSADLSGSLLGVLTMTGLAAAGTAPAVWLGVAILPLLWLSRERRSFVVAAAVAGLAVFSANGAVFSPYNRIDVKPYWVEGEGKTRVASSSDWELSANRDFHQYILDLSRRTVETSPAGSWRPFFQAVYELPFRVHPGGGEALVVGAGTGNDAAAALRSGYSRVTAVEIDPAHLRLGKRLHPERPYSDPRVQTVANDARAYFEQHPGERFDVVCYGLLDSHALLSSMSSLRLENYVYTVEGMRAGWAHVKEDGLLAISFSVYGGGWLVKRMIGLVREATGLLPTTVVHGMNAGVTFLVARRLDPQRLPKSLGPVGIPYPPDPTIRTPTDDWPFLYLRPHVFPYAYAVILALILLTAIIAVRKVYRSREAGGRRFHVSLFLMGAAFMLLETRMVSALSLLFGSTWVVNASVFAGVLVMVLVANQMVARREPRRVGPLYVPLVLSLIVVWAVAPGFLNRLPLVSRGLIGGLLYALPVAFAGVIFSCLLKRSRDTVGALGSNLLGAMFGGSLEYLSMFVGLRSLALLALTLYLGSLLFVVRGAASGREGVSGQVLAETGAGS